MAGPLPLCVLNIPVSRHEYGSTSMDRLYEAAYRKIKETVLAMYHGTDEGLFSVDIGKRIFLEGGLPDPCFDVTDLQSLFLLSDSVDKKAWHYGHIQSGSGDIAEIEPYFPGITLADYLAIFSFYLSADDFQPYEAGIDFAHSVDEDLMYEYAPDELEEGERGFDSWAESEQALADDFIRAGQMADGEDFPPDVVSFLEDINDSFNGVMSLRFIFDNLSKFLAVLVDGCEACTLRVTSISSTEAYLYKTYRERVPEKERGEADGYLYVLDHPFPGADSYTATEDRICETTGEGVHNILFLSGESYDYLDCPAFSTIHPFYEDAVKWLDKNLPILRDKYGR